MKTRILVLENDIATSELIRINLERSGFQVRCFSYGAKAIAHLEATKEDLLVLDYSLPDMTGKEVIEALAQKKIALPFIVITGHGDERIAVEMMKLGSRDYIIKDSAFLNLLPSVVSKVLNHVDMQQKLELIEGELETSHHFNQLILDALPCLAFILDKDGSVISSNRSQKTNNSLPFAKDFLVDLNECRPDFFKQAGEIIKDVTAFYEEFSLKERTWEIHWVPLNSELCVCYVFDVTEQRAVERSVRASEEERYRALVKNLPVGLFRSTTDYGSKITMYNPSAAKIFGFDPSEVDFEINVLDYYVHPEDRKVFFEKLMSEGRVIQHEALLKNRYNNPLWISVTANLIRDPKGKPLYIDGMLEDVTERKEAEEELRKRRDHLSALVEIQKILLSFQTIEEFLPRILEVLGTATGASRVYLYKKIACRETDYISLWKEWCAPGVRSQMDDPRLQAIPTEGVFALWKDRLEKDEHIAAMIDNLPQDQQEFFRSLENGGKNYSILLFPLVIQGGLYGLVGLDNLRENRRWEDSEIELLNSVAASISLGLERKLVEQEILKYREHLEELVAAKTAELVETNRRLEEEIFEKIKREKDLEGSRDYLDKIINALPDPLFVKDQDHRWILLNDAFCSFLGYSREALLGKSDHDFFPEEEARVFWEKDDLVFAAREDIINEEFLTDNEGVTHTIITKKTLYTDSKNKPYLLGIIRDITELKHLQEELVRSERLAAVGTLASGISHEFNNINVAILGFSELALSRFQLEPQLRDWIERIHNSALRAKSITQNLLAFGRTQKSSRSLKKLSTVVKESFELARRDLEMEEITFHLELNDVPETMMDENQITQVILNLLINARHAMLGRTRKELTIETGQKNGMIFARFTDTGCGIPQEHIKDIFTPFFTTKGAFGTTPSESSLKGTGLGLSVSHTILKNHKGKITVESKEGLGSTFTLFLPSIEFLSRDEGVEDELKKTKKRIAPAPLEPQKIHTMIVLDDEPDTLDLFALYFEPLGFKVIKTDDGEEALSLIANDSIDFVLTDIQMPKLNGVDFLKRLEALPEEKHPTIFIVTGRSNDSIVQDCLSLGAAEIILKPFQLDKIHQLLQDYLQKGASSSEA